MRSSGPPFGSDIGPNKTVSDTLYLQAGATDACSIAALSTPCLPRLPA